MNRPFKKLERDFYLRPTLDVARDLIRKTILFNHPSGLMAADIVETEAYVGESDPACHAAPGRTKRNGIMYEVGGRAYLYLIYGMYHCFNIVTERGDFPAAVLIRAVEPVSGLEIIKRHSPVANKGRALTDGPGKFCRAFDLTLEQNGLDLTGDILYLEHRQKKEPRIEISRRIGISKGVDKMWRFFDADSDCASRR